VPILKDWPLVRINEMSEHFKKKMFEPGEKVYDLGDPSSNVYFV